MRRKNWRPSVDQSEDYSFISKQDFLSSRLPAKTSYHYIQQKPISERREMHSSQRISLKESLQISNRITNVRSDVSSQDGIKWIFDIWSACVSLSTRNRMHFTVLQSTSFPICLRNSSHPISNCCYMHVTRSERDCALGPMAA